MSGGNDDAGSFRIRTGTGAEISRSHPDQRELLDVTKQFLTVAGIARMTGYDADTVLSALTSAAGTFAMNHADNAGEVKLFAQALRTYADTLEATVTDKN